MPCVTVTTADVQAKLKALLAAIHKDLLISDPVRSQKKYNP
jgi:hypothetical protein